MTDPYDYIAEAMILGGPVNGLIPSIGIFLDYMPAIPAEKSKPHKSVKPKVRPPDQAKTIIPV